MAWVEHMKLRKIYESILTEIGDSVQVPNASYFISKHSGEVKFNFLGDEYFISIRLPILNDESSPIRLAAMIDFDINGGNDHAMTNKHNALKLMSFVVGGLEEWFKRYSKKFGIIEINYIKYNPKSEDDETFGADGNKRDRVYRMFIEKFAKRYNSSVNFSTTGGLIAQFKPPIEIK